MRLPTHTSARVRVSALFAAVAMLLGAPAIGHAAAWAQLGLVVSTGNSPANISVTGGNDQPVVSYNETGSQRAYAKRWNGSAWQFMQNDIGGTQNYLLVRPPFLGYDITDADVVRHGSTTFAVASTESNISDPRLFGFIWNGAADWTEEAILSASGSKPDQSNITSNGSLMAISSTLQNNTFVVQLGTNPTTWNPVGGAIAVGAINSVFGDISLVGGQPWVAIRQRPTSGTIRYETRVLNWNGSAWVQPQAAILNMGSTVADSTSSIAIANDSANRPYIAWVENGSVYVKRWNSGAGTWDLVDGGLLGTGASNVDVAVHPETQMPYVTWTTAGTAQYARSLRGTTWSPVTTVATGITAVEGAIAFSGNTPFVGTRESASSGTIRVTSYGPNVVPTTPTLGAITTPSMNTTPTLSTNAFSDSDVLDMHWGTTWQIRTSAGSYASPAWTSGLDTTNLLSRTPSALADGAYCYRARHHDAISTFSAWATEQCFTVDTVAPTPNPMTGTGVATSATSLTWTPTPASDLNGLHTTPYSVDQGSASWTAAPGTFVESPLTPNTQYTRTVRARDAAGNERTGTVTARTWPDVPASPAATATDWNVTDGYALQLSWSAPTNGASSYDVRTSPGNALIANVAGTSRLVTGLAADTSYSYRICARNADSFPDTSLTTATCTAVLTATTAPPPPTAVTTSNVADTSLRLTWTAAAGATEYEVSRHAGSGCAAGATTSSTASSPWDSGAVLSLDREYTFRVRSRATLGAYGAPSSCVAITTATARTSLTVSVDSGTVDFGYMLPGTTNTGSTTITTETHGSTGYSIQASVDQQPTSGGDILAALLPGSLALPLPWGGSGLGFTITSAVNRDVKWGIPALRNYAPFSTTPQTIHSTGAAFAPNTYNSTNTTIQYSLGIPIGVEFGVYESQVTYEVVPNV